MKKIITLVIIISLLLLGCSEGKDEEPVQGEIGNEKETFSTRVIIHNMVKYR